MNIFPHASGQYVPLFYEDTNSAIPIIQYFRLFFKREHNPKISLNVLLCLEVKDIHVD